MIASKMSMRQRRRRKHRLPDFDPTQVHQAFHLPLVGELVPHLSGRTEQ